MHKINSIFAVFGCSSFLKPYVFVELIIFFVKTLPTNTIIQITKHKRTQKPYILTKFEVINSSKYACTCTKIFFILPCGEIHNSKNANELQVLDVSDLKIKFLDCLF